MNCVELIFFRIFWNYELEERRINIESSLFRCFGVVIFL